MRRRSLFALLFIGLSGIASANDARRVDCESKIPRHLVAHLVAAEPTLSLPAKEDLDQANIDFDIASGGDGCYLISKGMFDGEQDEAFALLPVARSGTPNSSSLRGSAEGGRFSIFPRSATTSGLAMSSEAARALMCAQKRWTTQPAGRPNARS